MHVIIVGGGEIGFSLAKALAVGHDVFVIDQAPAVADRFEALDVQFLLGTGTSADVLKRAGIEHAGILVACTGLDEVNIVTCAIGNRLDRRAPSASSPTRISSSSRSASPDDSGERIRRIDSMAIVAATWLVMARRGSLRGGAVRLGRAYAHRRAVRIDVRVDHDERDSDRRLRCLRTRRVSLARDDALDRPVWVSSRSSSPCSPVSRSAGASCSSRRLPARPTRSSHPSFARLRSPWSEGRAPRADGALHVP